MSCNASSSAGPIPVWSPKTTASWIFHPLAPPVDGTRHRFVRASFEVQQNSGAAKIRPALRMTDDGVNFDNPVAIGTATRNANGTTYGSAFEDMSGTTAGKSQVQYGIECTNDSGSVLEMCMASIKIDIREA